MAKTDQKKDQPAEGSAKPPLVKRLVKLVGIGLICLAALFGGLVAAMGPSQAIALLTGGDSSDTSEMATDSHAPAASDGHGTDTADAGGHGAPAGDDGHGAASETIVVTPFKEIIVNVTATTATGRQTSRFLKLNVALAYDSSQPGATNIEDRKLFLRDSFQDYLRQLSDADLQGSIGLSRLKAELLRRARVISDSSAPQELLIADLIIQ